MIRSTTALLALLVATNVAFAQAAKPPANPAAAAAAATQEKNFTPVAPKASGSAVPQSFEEFIASRNNVALFTVAALSYSYQSLNQACTGLKLAKDFPAVLLKATKAEAQLNGLTEKDIQFAWDEAKKLAIERNEKATDAQCKESHANLKGIYSNAKQFLETDIRAKK